MRYLFLITMLMGLAFAGRVESHDDVTWNHNHFWLSEAAYDDLDHDSIRWTGGHNHAGDGVKHRHPNDPEHGGQGTASKAHLMGFHGAVLKNAPAPVKPVKNNNASPPANPAPPAPIGGSPAPPEQSTEPEQNTVAPIGVSRCPVGWQKGNPHVIIYAIEMSYANRAFAIDVIELRADDSIENLDGYSLRLGTLYSQGHTVALPDGLEFTNSILRIDDLDFPTRTGSFAGQDVPSFDYRLISPNRKRVDLAYACYLESPVDTITMLKRETARIERNIVLDWEADSYRSRWQLVETDAPNAPSLIYPKLTTLWATLKRR